MNMVTVVTETLYCPPLKAKMQWCFGGCIGHHLHAK